MEKQRIKSIAESFGRLLIVLLFFSSRPLYSQTLTNAMLRELKIAPADGQTLCVNSEIKFQVIIPYTLPGQIEVSMPAEKDDVSFKTLRKVDSDGGTKIEVWFTFAKTGRYQLEPLTVKIKNSRRQLNFEPVTIGINPKEQSPLCVILRGSERNKDITVTAGQKIKFRVCLLYATQLVHFSWTIPKDSIFVQGKLYDFTEIKQREKVVSDELIPVCDFEWTPLVPGVMDFPSFDIKAVSYNGEKSNVAVPKIKVTVLKARSSLSDNELSYFDSAFETDEEIADNKGFNAISPAESKAIALRIAELRRIECKRFSIKARRERIEGEKLLGLPHTQEEFCDIWIYLSAALVLGVAVFLIILIYKKRRGWSIVCGAGLVCALILLIYCFVLGKRSYGISSGAQVYSIPEASATVKSEIPAGNRVQIISASGDWYFIHFGETEGWTNKEEVFISK